MRPVPALNMEGGVGDIILCHHERFDGKGYPRGLRAGEIPSGARIVAVADTLSALLSNRSYRPGCCFDAACAEIRRCSGSQFDPVVVRAFENNVEKIRTSLNHLDYEAEAPCASTFRPAPVTCNAVA